MEPQDPANPSMAELIPAVIAMARGAFASDRANPSLADLMSAVGFFLLRWGWLESTLESRPVPDELADVRKMRNTICHGMRSAYADASEDASTSYIECRSLDGIEVKYSYKELHDAIRRLEKAFRAHEPMK